MSLWVSLIFSLVGALIFVLIIRYILITSRCSKWPVVVGEVISSEMKAKYKKLAQFAEATHTAVGLYQPDITYTYEINGNKFTNNQVRPVGRNVWKQIPDVQRVLNLYPVGSKVYPFYNPRNSKISVLDPWIRFSPIAITIPTALIFFGLGLSFSGINFLIDWGINLISYALYVASVLLFAQNIRYLVKVLKSKKWPAVEGEIKKVFVYRGGSAENGQASFNVDVTYTYNVEGQNYTNHQIKLDYTHGARTYVPKIFAMMKVEKYEEDKNIKVFYDPNNPNKSFLEHGLRSFTFILMFIVAIGLFFFGWLGISGMLRSIIAG